MSTPGELFLPPLPQRIDSAKDVLRPALSPSEYLKDRKLELPEKLSKMATLNQKSQIAQLHSNDSVSLKPFTVPIDTPLFEAFPSEVHLQNYKPFQTYEVVIAFRNMDRFARHLKIKPLDSSIFSISSLKTGLSLQTNKLATGMEAQFVLRFTPPDCFDYAYTIECITERETFFVPIIAVGNRAIIDISDEISLGRCPVNFSSSKTILLRNIGNAPSKFEILASSPFSITPSAGYLKPNDSLQVELSIKPVALGNYNGELILVYHTGERIVSKLKAFSHEVNIYLETPSIQFEDQSIKKNLVKKMKIVNHSDIMVHYDWKRFKFQSEEDIYKLNRIKAIKETSTDDSCAADPALSSRKLNANIIRVQNEDLDLENSVFCIEPKNGIIWPHSSVEASVVFSPLISGLAEATWFCSVSGIENRLPLSLKGNGFGPKLKLSKNYWNIGEAFIGVEQKFSFSMENKGQIPAPYSFLMESTVAAVNFEPATGVVDVNAKTLIQCKYTPKTLGSLAEVFKIIITGSESEVKFSIKCQCLAPTFEFDCTDVVFPDTSTGFTSSQQLTLYNTSPILFHYKLKLTSSDASVFAIKPEIGFVPPHASRPLKISCTPENVGKITGTLFLDIQEIGEKVHLLPVTVQSDVPKISVLQSQLKFDNCFLSVPYHKKISIKNEDGHYGVVVVIGNDGVKSSNFDLEMNMISDILEPFATLVVDCRVIAHKLGSFNFPISVSVKNALGKKFVVDVSVIGTGPEITVPTKEVKFGKVQVLEQHVYALLIKNTSPIVANYSAYLVNPHSNFAIDMPSGSLKPSEERELIISVYLHDNIKSSDILKLSVDNGIIRDIHLSAQGVGSNVLFDCDMKNLNFGDVLTSESCEKIITVTNHSKRSQNFMFKKLIDSESTFIISPDRFSMKSLAQQQITIRGSSKGAKSINECIVCFGTSEHDPNRRIIVESTISATFIAPSISVNKQSLDFSYIEGDFSAVVIEQEVAIQNNISFPLKIRSQCSAPFSINRESSFIIGPREIVIIKVSFDPETKKDRKCASFSSSLVLNLSSNSEAITIELNAKIVFPNISLSSNVMNIPSTSPGFRKSDSFKMTNNGSLDVHYEWFIEKSKSNFIYDDGDNSIDPLVFDVLPQYGVIYPGETVPTLVTFLSQRRGEFNLSLICKVKYGPLYRVKVSIRCFDVSYTLSTNVIELGDVCFDEIVEKSITIKNTGDIEIPLQIHMTETDNSMKHKLMITSSSSCINPRETATLIIKYCPCFLGSCQDSFFVQMSHLKLEKFLINVNSLYPKYFIDLPVLNSRIIGCDLPDDEFWRLNENISNTLTQFELEGKNVLSIASKNEFSRSRERRNDPFSFLDGTPDFQGTYSCNLGFLSQTQIKRKSFVIKNNGKIPFTVQCIRGAYEEKGFTIEYDKIQTLSSGEFIKVLVSLKAPKSILDDTTIKCDAVIELSHGIKLAVVLTANFCVPNLLTAAKDINFGEVFVGQKKTISVLITNSSLIACDWKLPAPPGNKQNMKMNLEMKIPKEIILSTTSGQLLPGQSTYIDFSFSPKQSQNVFFNLNFQIMNSAKFLEFSVQATGVLPKLLIETPILNFGQLVPYSEPVERMLTLKNPSKYTLELYYFDLLEACENVQTEVQTDCQISRSNIDRVIVLHGPPLSGQTSLSLHICDIYGFNYVCIDDLIVAALEKRGSVLAEKVKAEIAKFKTNGEENIPVDNMNEFGMDFDSTILGLVISDFFKRFQNGHHVFIVDSLTSSYVKNPIVVLNALYQAFEPQTRFQFVHITADIMLLQKREKDGILTEILTQISELERDINELNKCSQNNVELIEQKNTEILRLKKLASKKNDIDSLPNKNIIHSLEDYKKTKRLSKVSVKDKAAAVKKPIRKPSIISGEKIDENDSSNNYENALPQVLEIFQGIRNSREYEIYSSTIESLIVKISEGFHDESKVSNLEKKMAMPKSRSLMAVVAEPESKECNTSLIEYSTMDGLDYVLIELSNLLQLSMSDASQAEAKPGIVSTIQVLNHSQDFKSQTKNFRIVSSSESPSGSLTNWTLVPDGKISILVKFTPCLNGKLEEELVLGIKGILEPYVIKCVATTIYPSFSLDPLKLFAKYRKSKEIEDIVAGEFILDTKTYEFGSLICRVKDTKATDRHKAVFSFLNESENPIKINASFKGDLKGEVFTMESSSCLVAPGNRYLLNVWAFPKLPIMYEDMLICSISDNPEPVFINITCSGTKLELDFDKKQMNFEKNSIGILEKREITFRNPTTIPLIWKLQLQDISCDELSFPLTEGVLPPHDKIVLAGLFKSTKQVVFKKNAKIELYEAERPTHIAAEASIIILAEAYEVAVDVTYPKAGSEFLDFGIIRVDEEFKQCIILKNRCKFDVGFRFVPANKELSSLCEAIPSSGCLNMNDKNTSIQIGFACSFPRVFTSETILFCELFEMTRESVIGRIPIKVLAQVLKSSHQIFPPKKLDFGKCCIGSKVSRQIIIENNGPYDLKYSFCRSGSQALVSDVSNNPNLKKKVRGSQAVISTVKRDMQFGSFYLNLSNGVIPVNSKAVITVDFWVETEGTCTENLILDCSDRDVEYFDEGCEYIFSGESQIPELNLTDFTKLFQSVDIVRDLLYWKGTYPVFSVNDNALFFGPTLLNSITSIPIAMINVTEVNCDVNLTVKSKHRSEDSAFNVTPKTITLGPQESCVSNITFQSTDLDTCYGTFEASVDNAKSTQRLTFDMIASSLLPQLQITNLLNESGTHSLKFVSTSVGTSSEAFITIYNRSPISSTLFINGLDNDIFTCNGDLSKLKPGEMRNVTLMFKPDSLSEFKKEIHVGSIENIFEVFIVTLLGEGITNNLIVAHNGVEVTEIPFGHSFVGIPKSIWVTLQNCFTVDQKISLIYPMEVSASPNSIILGSKERKNIHLSYVSEKQVKSLAAPFKIVVQDTELISSEREFVFPIIATSDYSTFELSKNAVEFGEIKVFETKSSSIILKNTGLQTLSYELSFFNDDGQIIGENDVFCANSNIGQIEIGKEENICFKFQPMHVGIFTEYSAVLLVSNSNPEHLPPCIKLRGSSIAKEYHISYELKSSDFMHAQIPTWVTYFHEDLSQRSILFNNLSGKVLDYYIESNEFNYNVQHHVTDGKLNIGLNDIKFSIKNLRAEIQECKFTLSLPSLNISEIIRVQHLVKRLEVSTDKYAINFSNIKSAKSSVKSFCIVNNESFPVNYQIEVFREAGQTRSFFQVDSLSGIVPQKGVVTKTVTFKPEHDRVYESNLNIIFTNIPQHTGQVLYLKGEGYDLHEKVILCEGGIEKVLQTVDKSKELLNIGRLVLGEEKLSQVSIQNNGRYAFDFSWSIVGSASKILKISPLLGRVSPGSTILCDLKFLSLVPLKDRKITATCIIDKEKKYVINISTYFTRSRIDLTESEINFGSNFLHVKESMRVLKLTNREKSDINLEAWTNSPSIFTSSLKFHTLSGGDVLEIKVYFKPIERKEYNDVLIIKVNSYSEYRIPLKGTAHAHDLQVLDVKDNIIEFGAMKAGSTYNRKARIKNNSALPIQIQVANRDILTKLLQIGCKVTPEKILIKSREVVPINFTFSPKGRLGSIKEFMELYTENNTLVKVITVTGTCQGVELQLSDQSIFLGPTLPNIPIYKTVLLENKGELGSKFSWDNSKLSGIFTMDPKDGFIAPKASVSLKFGFKPRTYLPEVKVESINCQIDGARHLTVHLSGSCPKNTVITDTIQFNTSIGAKDVKSILVANPSSSIWRVQPAISGLYFSSSQELAIEPNQVKQCHVTYMPGEMTGNKNHEGLLNIPLPDKSSKLYKLIGCAEKPLAISDVAIVVKSRSPQNEILSISNWLQKPQRLILTFESVNNDPMIIISSETTEIKLLPGETKPFKYLINCLKEGLYQAKITFSNPITGEYVWYSLNCKAHFTEPDIINIVSSVRQKTSKVISLKNPLDTPLVMNFTCSANEIAFPTTLMLSPRSETPFCIDFLPLQSGESSVKLISSSSEFGNITYELKLNAKPANPIKIATFQCALGSSQIQTIKFTSYSKSRMEYFCKIENADFSCEKAIVVAASQTPSEIAFDICFEPSEVKEYHTTLIVTSASFGDYEFTLHGTCSEPQTQGPYLIKAGQTFNLSFKNVFHTNGNYIYAIDNPNFSVKGPDVINARKSGSVLINLPSKISAEKNTAMRTGKLVVTNTIANTSWVYYLKEQQ